jgi:hypothetical protein
VGFIQGLYILIKAIPDFLNLAKEIMKFLHELEDYLDRKNRLKELKEAVKDARENKDTSKLDQLFGAPPPSQ